MRSRILLTLAIVLVGCNRNAVTPPPARSPFSNNCNLQAIVMRSVPGPDREAMWGYRGVDTGSSRYPGHLDNRNDFHGAFFYQTREARKVECRPEDVDRFMSSIDRGIIEAAADNDTTLFDRRYDRRGSLMRGFRMKYTYRKGKARGTVEAEIEPDQTPAGLTTLYVRIHEVVAP